jgi:hypothetical protein
MRPIRVFSLSILLLIAGGCSPNNKKYNEYSVAGSDARSVSHDSFTTLLQKFVSPEGKVNYKGLLQDSVALGTYLKSLSDHPPAKTWPRNEQLAYWLNAYNGFTLQLVLRHYPVSSIKDIGSKIQIPFVNTPWDVRFIRIGKTFIDLNEIEHGILRAQLKEPRIHFAIVCASVSCPKLLNEAFTAQNLDQQLTNQAKAFINDPARNKIAPDQVQVSKIFSWFKSDFTQKGSFIAFLNQYTQVKINSEARVTYLDYDWKLNE